MAHKYVVKCLMCDDRWEFTKDEYEDPRYAAKEAKFAHRKTTGDDARGKPGHTVEIVHVRT